MKGSGVYVNKPAAVFCCVAVLLVVLYIISGFHNKRNSESTSSMSEKQNWKSWKIVAIPQSIINSAKHITVKDETVTFSVAGKEVKVFTQQAASSTSSKLSVLFLHGKAFTSKNWLDLGTLQLVAAMDFRVVAVDLPGFGKSPEVAISDRVALLEKLIETLRLQKPVIVSPSMSGAYSLPYLFSKPSAVLERASGFIPIAPVETGAYAAELYQGLKIPTLIICGEKDTRLGPLANGNLKNLPNNRLFILEGAGHPAYLDKPDEFHKLVYNFLMAIF